MFDNFYNGRKVFVTGHTGFKGSWLTAWLLSLGADVTGFSLNIPTTPSCFDILGLREKTRDLRGDIRNLEALSGAIREAKPDVVFHLAAQALVRASYQNPVETFETNAIGTLNVLEAVRRTPSIGAAVIVTSDKCYRNNEWAYGYREIDRLGGDDPYSASKGCAEFVAHSYFTSFFRDGPACATVRAGNVIGGGDWAKDRIVPDCARAWYAGATVEIRNPWATRPWQHVLEPLSGYLWLAANMAKRPEAFSGGLRAFNFGPPSDAIHPVADVVAALQRQWPGFAHETIASDTLMKESGLLKLCCDLALSELHWKATWDFEETMRATADWYARYHASQDGMWEYTLGQISAYCNVAQNRNLPWSLHAGKTCNPN